MTKFILHGGFQKGKTDENNVPFYSEILKDTNHTSILIVPFAKDDDRMVDSIEKVKQRFLDVAQDKNLEISVATHDTFIQQLQDNDIIYFCGGTSIKLLQELSPYENISQYLNGKVVAGESAGANILCTYFYSPSANAVLEGLKLLPIKFIPHFTQDKKDVLNGYGENLETLFLEEYSYKIIYQ